MLKFVRAHPRLGSVSTNSVSDLYLPEIAEKQVVKNKSKRNSFPNELCYPTHEEYETFVEMLIMENRLLFEQKTLNRLRRQRYIDELCKQQLISEQILKNHAVPRSSPIETSEQIHQKFAHRIM